MKLRHSLPLLTACTVLLTPMAHAAEEPKGVAAPAATPAAPAPSDTVTIPEVGAGQTHFRVMPPKIKPVQTGEEIAGAAPTLKLTPHTTLDKLTLSDRASFDADFWAGTDIEALSTFLATPTPALRSPSLRALMTKAVLTPADDTDEDHDVYSLRIAKLVEIGDFSAALALYKLNEQSPPSSLAARAGVEAMMGQGETGVACLEQKALDKGLKTDSPEFWATLDTFCQSLLGPAAAQGGEMDENARLQNAARVFLTAINAAPPATIADTNNLPLPQLMALARTGKLNDLISKTSDLSVLHDKTLKALVMVPNVSRAISGKLLAESLGRGLMTATELDRIFALPTADQSPAAGMAAADDWKSFLALYNAKEFAASPVIVAQTAKVGGPLALLAKVDNFTASAAANGNNPAYLRDVLMLATKTNHAIPAEHLQKAYPQANQAAPASVNTEELPSGEKLLTDIFAAQYKDDPRRMPQIMAIQAVLSDKGIKENEKKSAYDNIFSLTPSDNYVMPNGENLSNLQKSADKKLAGQVVIDSLRMLSGDSLQKVHPAALYKILTALDSAGLNEETVAIVRDALGNIIEESTKEK